LECKHDRERPRGVCHAPIVCSGGHETVFHRKGIRHHRPCPGTSDTHVRAECGDNHSPPVSESGFSPHGVRAQGAIQEALLFLFLRLFGGCAESLCSYEGWSEIWARIPRIKERSCVESALLLALEDLAVEKG
jgi:hypothetical protein